MRLRVCVSAIARPGSMRYLQSPYVDQPSTRRPASAATVARAAPLGVPVEDVHYTNEWPSPNGDLYNQRVAQSTISSANVSKLRIAWTIPLTGAGLTGSRDVANPIIAHGTVYLQDGASNVTAVRLETGRVLWTHQFNSPDYGPNGVTIATGCIYGVTARGAFALAVQTGRQVWYNTHLAAGRPSFDVPPQVANGRVFVASALTVGGGILYALNARNGSTIWRFQTVVDKIGRHLKSTAGGAWDAVLIGPGHSIYADIGNPYLSQYQGPRRPAAANSIPIVLSSSVRPPASWNGITRRSPTTSMTGTSRFPPSTRLLEVMPPCLPRAKEGTCSRSTRQAASCASSA